MHFLPLPAAFPADETAVAMELVMAKDIGITVNPLSNVDVFRCPGETADVYRLCYRPEIHTPCSINTHRVYHRKDQTHPFNGYFNGRRCISCFRQKTPDEYLCPTFATCTKNSWSVSQCDGDIVSRSGGCACVCACVLTG